MKSAKRLIAVLLAVMLIFALLAGCGPETADESETTDESAQNTEAANSGDGQDNPTAEPEAEWQYGDFELPICEEPVTLTEIKFLTSDEIAGGGPTGTQGFKTMTEMLGVDIEFILSDSANKAETVALYIVGGDYPDIWTGLNGIYGMSLQGAYEEDLIMDLTDYVDECLPNYKYVLSTDDYYALNAVTEDGKYLCAYRYRGACKSGRSLTVAYSLLTNNFYPLFFEKAKSPKSLGTQGFSRILHGGD